MITMITIIITTMCVVGSHSRGCLALCRYTRSMFAPLHHLIIMFLQKLFFLPISYAGWVLHLGPQFYLIDDKCAPCYEWAIISDQYSQSLFVIARNVDIFFEQYYGAVNDIIVKDGKC